MECGCLHDILTAEPSICPRIGILEVYVYVVEPVGSLFRIMCLNTLKSIELQMNHRKIGLLTYVKWICGETNILCTHALSGNEYK